ncbi:MAG: GNAT family N-acetyltransferase [Gammaproteobacteria bacterium]|nr:GNAT family N-acetyltransferase [Gammaproteobacteria bacterium]
MTSSPIHSLVFRTATLKDVNDIVELVQSAYRGDSSRNGWTTEADFLDGTRTDTQEVSDIILAADNVIVLAVNHGQLLASVHIQKQNDTAYLGMFAVHPSMQNAGLGRALLAEAENMARHLWQSRHMQMTVITLRHELIAWYERRAYLRTGISKPFPYGIARYGLPKRDDLVLELLEKTL